MAGEMPEKHAFFLDETGSVQSVPLSGVGDAYAREWTPASPEQVKDFKVQRAMQAKYGTVGQQIKTGVEGALEGATFGVSTAAETGLGIATPEDIKGRAEVNPGIKLGSQLAGGAALALGTAGLGTAAESAGLAAEAAPEAAGLLSRVGASAAKEAVTGAKWGVAQGAGSVVHEAALGDPNLSAQHIISQVGLSTLMGSGLGAVLGATGTLLPAALKASRDAIGTAFKGGSKAIQALQAAGEDVTGTTGNIANFMHEHTLQIHALESTLPGAAETISTATPEMADWIVKNGSRLTELEQAFPGTTRSISRVDPSTAEELATNWRQMVTDPNARKAMTGNLKGGMQDVVDTTNRLLKRINSEFGPGEEESLLNDVKYVKEAKVKAAYEDMTVKLGDAARDMRAKSEQFAPGYAAKLEEIQAGMVRDLNDVSIAEAKAGKTMPDDMVDAFRRMKTLRQQLDEQINWNAASGDLGLGERNAQKVLKDLRGQVRGVLHDPDVWGEAGARKAALDEAQSQWMKLTGKGSLFRKRFMEKGVGGGYEVPASKVNTWLNGMATGKGDESAAAWGEVMATAKRVLNEAEQSAQHVPSSNFSRTATEELLNKTGEQVASARQSASIAATHKQMMSGGMGIANSGPVGPALGGGMVGKAASFFLPGGVTSTLKTMTSVPRTVSILGAIQRAGTSVSKRIDSLAESIASGARASVPYAETSSGVLDGKRMQELASNPQLMKARLDDLTKDSHEHAPDTSQAVQATVARTTAFLASKYPPTIQNGPFAPKLEPSPGQLAAYNRCAQVANKPTGLLEHIAAGTATPDMVETLQACAPQILEQMRSSALAAATKHKGKIPYGRMLGLSALMGQSLDGTASMRALMANQAIYRMPSAKPMDSQTGPGAMKSTQAGLGKLKLGSQWATNGQGAETRRRGEY